MNKKSEGERNFVENKTKVKKLVKPNDIPI